MAKKDLKYFMRPEKEEIVTVPGLESIKDDDGKVIDFEIRVLSQKTLNEINDKYRRKSIAVDKKGNPIVNNGEVVWKIEKDNTKAAQHIIAEALVYPDLHDKELMEYYHCYDITEMPMNVFSSAEEYLYVSRVVLKALGLSDEFGDEDEEENEVEVAKN